jgi:hypothetical protein
MMKPKAALYLPLVVLMLASLACFSSTPATAPAAVVVTATGIKAAALPAAAATPNTQATVNAAIAATEQARTVIQATVGAAVQATVGALPPTATPAPAVEAATYTQEELEAMINDAVNQAVAATTQATAATTQATADQAMTTDEAQTAQVYVDGAEQAIAFANELMVAYSQVYGDLASEALTEMSQVEQDLETMAAGIATLSTTLQEVNTTLQQGQALAQGTIDQLNATAQAANANLEQTQAQLQAFQQKAQTGRDNLANQIAAIQPDNVPADLQATLAAAFAFTDLAHGALGDGKLDRSELLQLGQLGANVSAGFNMHGGPKMQGLSGNVNQITQQLSLGQGPRARQSLGNFENSLGQRPANLPKPAGPGGLPKPVRP